jgi:hypothetical protein
MQPATPGHPTPTTEVPHPPAPIKSVLHRLTSHNCLFHKKHKCGEGRQLVKEICFQGSCLHARKQQQLVQVASALKQSSWQAHVGTAGIASSISENVSSQDEWLACAGGGIEAMSAHIDKDEDSDDVIYDTNRIGGAFQYTFGPADGLVRPFNFILVWELCTELD